MVQETEELEAEYEAEKALYGLDSWIAATVLSLIYMYIDKIKHLKNIILFKYWQKIKQNLNLLNFSNPFLYYRFFFLGPCRFDG